MTGNSPSRQKSIEHEPEKCLISVLAEESLCRCSGDDVREKMEKDKNTIPDKRPPSEIHNSTCELMVKILHSSPDANTEDVGG